MLVPAKKTCLIITPANLEEGQGSETPQEFIDVDVDVDSDCDSSNDQTEDDSSTSEVD